jgi:hypothetical protein
MPVVDYRLFINRDLPMRDRACESESPAYECRGCHAPLPWASAE